MLPRRGCAAVLRYSPRSFDFTAPQGSDPPDPYVEACVKGSLLVLHRSLFEPLPQGLQEQQRGSRLHAAGAITLPRLLDAAALCGSANQVLASALCARALGSVPQLAGDVASLRRTLARVAGQVAGALPSAQERLRSRAPASGAAPPAGDGALTATEEDLLAYWADIAATLSHAVSACPSLAVAFLGPDAAQDAASEDAAPAPGASAVQDVHGGDGHSALAGTGACPLPPPRPPLRALLTPFSPLPRLRPRRRGPPLRHGARPGADGPGGSRPRGSECRRYPEPPSGPAPRAGHCSARRAPVHGRLHCDALCGGACGGKQAVCPVPLPPPARAHTPPHSPPPSRWRTARRGAPSASTPWRTCSRRSSWPRCARCPRARAPR